MRVENGLEERQSWVSSAKKMKLHVMFPKDVTEGKRGILNTKGAQDRTLGDTASASGPNGY